MKHTTQTDRQSEQKASAQVINRFAEHKENSNVYQKWSQQRPRESRRIGYLTDQYHKKYTNIKGNRNKRETEWTGARKRARKLARRRAKERK